LGCAVAELRTQNQRRCSLPAASPPEATVTVRFPDVWSQAATDSKEPSGEENTCKGLPVHFWLENWGLRVSGVWGSVFRNSSTESRSLTGRVEVSGVCVPARPESVTVEYSSRSMVVDSVTCGTGSGLVFEAHRLLYHSA